MARIFLEIEVPELLLDTQEIRTLVIYNNVGVNLRLDTDEKTEAVKKIHDLLVQQQNQDLEMYFRTHLRVIK